MGSGTFVAKKKGQITIENGKSRTPGKFWIDDDKLRSIFETMRYGLTIQNLEYDIIYQNKTIRDIAGDCLGKKCYRVYEGKNKACNGCPVSMAFKDGKSHTAVRRVVMPSGEVCFWENTATPIKDDNEEIVACYEIAGNITKRKLAEEALKESESTLQEQKMALEQKNIALKEVLAQIEIEKRQIKNDVIDNIENVLLPILDKLKSKSKSEGISHKYIHLLQKSLCGLTSSFGKKITEKSAKLTSKEIEICNMIKNGLTSKEMSNLLNISLRTIEKHRFNIRKKLGINKNSFNLVSFLQSL